MKISEITELSKCEKVLGIVVDEYKILEIKDLQLISFLALPEKDEPTTLSIDLIDVLIDVVTKVKEVIVEIPFDTTLNLEEEFSNAFSIGYNIAYLPPKDNDNIEDWETYTKNLELLTDLMFKYTENKQQIYPVTSYLQRMIEEHFNHAPEALSTDDFILSRYVDDVDYNSMTAMKARLHKSIIKGFGSNEDFIHFANNISKATEIANTEIIIDGYNALKENLANKEKDEK